VNQQVVETQETALRSLYERIKQIVETMNGVFTETKLPSSLPDQNCDDPSNLSVTALHVELPSGVMVDFKPALPLGFAITLFVKARRTLSGHGVFNDMDLSFADGEWQYSGHTLSDEVIRECLTPKGPVPIY
jgi:hypothetical protein